MGVSWQLQEAKNKFSEVVERALSGGGPQEITRHGKKAAVVLSFRDYERLRRRKGSLAEFFRQSPLNQLVELPSAVSNLVSLSLLNIAVNPLDTFPSEISTLVSLTELRLNATGLTSLPSSIGNLQALERLELLSNRLTALPPEFLNLGALQELILGSNQLTSLPEGFDALSNLVVLTLEHNSLSSLPTGFDGLGNLVSLNLGANSFRCLGPEIGNLSSLEGLVIAYNRITDLPSTILELPLSVISIGDNRLCDISDTLETWLDTYGYPSTWRNGQQCDIPFFTSLDELPATVGVEFGWRFTYYNPLPESATVSSIGIIPSWLTFPVPDSTHGTPTSVGIDSLSVVLSVADSAYDTLTVSIVVTQPTKLSWDKRHHHYASSADSRQGASRVATFDIRGRRVRGTLPGTRRKAERSGGVHKRLLSSGVCIEEYR